MYGMSTRGLVTSPLATTRAVTRSPTRATVGLTLADVRLMDSIRGDCDGGSCLDDVAPALCDVLLLRLMGAGESSTS